ncbi:ADP-forming succinate--CoA ligase subunit beta [Corynebacterium guangdongense]|uniref:Succinate--CoA ligase [ADP-forming] subunit beta n=1 Tax=Corynebacterium guangdongense TaxID=1783348 RepID=A0ABU2A0D0_9CORY|nr:ADP-forming succinate--CoA ligase subunit beta [Corynebacterium guangdongense]MDR7330651.1 succinyl-CoA synthetase beta subunit [Corynebacterium guangdongense]WJZ16667.1 Succinyl-CoA ligase [ADP-forming] subunit beta [Corynebacterium guangdongense]
MNLYEYQARELLESFGVPTAQGRVATTPAEAREAAEAFGGTVVVKAQVHTGGRGKAGGVKVVHSPEEAENAAAKILGMDIKGHTVHKVMVAQGVDIAEEYYFSLLLDRTNRSYLALCSTEGGVDIETLAEEHPDKLARVSVDPLVGVDEAKAREIADSAGFTGDVAYRVVPVLQKLWRAYHDSDATLVEVNPLVRTAGGEILALDAKVTLDANAEFRHNDYPDPDQSDGDAGELEAIAREHDLNYVKLDGSVGVIGNGAGLVMASLDVVAAAGKLYGNQKPANFLDIGGGASQEVMETSLKLVLSDRQVRSVFINVFGGITACDVVAKGIVGALAVLGRDANVPIVVRLDGNNVDEGRRILSDFQHPLVTVMGSMDAAAHRAAALAQAH